MIKKKTSSLNLFIIFNFITSFFSGFVLKGECLLRYVGQPRCGVDKIAGLLDISNCCYSSELHSNYLDLLWFVLA